MQATDGRGKFPIILLPGLFAGAWIWSDAAECLRAKGLEDVRIVNESFAASDCMLGGTVAPATDSIMRSLGADPTLRQVVLCGNSFGGLVALDAAARYPDRVAGAIISGAPGLGPDVSFGLPERADLSFAYNAVARLFHNQSRIPRNRVEETFNILARPRPLRNVVKGLKASRIYDVPGALANLRCPTLFVWGQFDEVSPVGPWVQPVAALEKARLAIVPDSGHSPMLEQPAVFADQVRDFLLDFFPGPLSNGASCKSVQNGSSPVPADRLLKPETQATPGTWNAVDSAPVYRSLNEELCSLAPVPARAVVLDLGCGSGGISSIVLEHQPDARVCAVDPSEEMLASIPDHLRARIECLCTRAEDLDRHIPPGFATRVFSANCIHLFEDRARAFAAIYNVLDPGGWVALSTTFFEGGRDPASAPLERELIFTAASILLRRSPGTRLSRRRDGVANLLSSQAIKQELATAGFASIRCETTEALLDADALVDLLGSTHFAGAIFPDVSPQLAAEVLREAAVETLNRNGIKQVKRNWLFIAGCKETFDAYGS